MMMPIRAGIMCLMGAVCTMMGGGIPKQGKIVETPAEVVQAEIVDGKIVIPEEKTYTGSVEELDIPGYTKISTDGYEYVEGFDDDYIIEYYGEDFYNHTIEICESTECLGDMLSFVNQYLGEKKYDVTCDSDCPCDYRVWVDDELLAVIHNTTTDFYVKS